MKWCTINGEYLEYLKQTESRIPNYIYNKQKENGTAKKILKPFFVVLFQHKGFTFVAQVNHPKEKHIALPEGKDFKKIYHPNDPKKLLCVVNLNYMFPVPNNEINYLTANQVTVLRDFDSEVKKNRYINLLNMELSQMEAKNLEKEAETLFNEVMNNKETKLSKRCFNYESLEEKCAEWTRTQIIDKVSKNEYFPFGWEYYHPVNNVLHKVVGQSSDNPEFIASMPKEDFEKDYLSNINLYEINNNKFTLIANLFEDVELFGKGNIDEIIETSVKELMDK